MNLENFNSLKRGDKVYILRTWASEYGQTEDGGHIECEFLARHHPVDDPDMCTVIDPDGDSIGVDRRHLKGRGERPWREGDLAFIDHPSGGFHDLDPGTYAIRLRQVASNEVQAVLAYERRGWGPEAGCQYFHFPQLRRMRNPTSEELAEMPIGTILHLDVPNKANAFHFLKEGIRRVRLHAAWKRTNEVGLVTLGQAEGDYSATHEQAVRVGDLWVPQRRLLTDEEYRDLRRGQRLWVTCPNEQGAFASLQKTGEIEVAFLKRYENSGIEEVEVRLEGGTMEQTASRKDLRT